MQKSRMPFGTLAIIIGVVIVFIGATIQGTVGFGINMLSAPVIAVIAPRAMPSAVVLVALPLCVIAFLREHGSYNRLALPWLLLGILPGTLLGLFIIASVGRSTLQVIIGAITLVGVGLSALRWHVTITPLSSFFAGTVANVFGTASGSSGSPVALLYQNEPAAQTRATLGAFFTGSASTSIIGYLALGRLGMNQFLYALCLLPAMLIGLWISRYFHSYMDAGWFRPSILMLCALAGAVAVINGLI